MTLHLIKLCVGVDAPDELRAWRAQRAAQGLAPIVPTRHTPKRAGEILKGGSLYWVIKGQVLIRQRILAVETLEDGARSRCELLLDGVLVDTAPQPRRPFQGWRYLEAKDAPPDLTADEHGAPMSQALAQQLREIGAW